MCGAINYYDNRYMHFARQRDPTTGDMNSEEEPTNAENQDMKLQLSHTVHNGTESWSNLARLP